LLNPITLIMILIFVSCKANALDSILKQKYPYSILTKDHDILPEKDLDTSKHGVYPPPFSPRAGFGYIYWQCFSRENISISLEDLGYSSEDIGGDNYSKLKIRITGKPGIEYHEYIMRRAWSTVTYQDKFNAWIKLMKGVKYVCLAGSFIDRVDKVDNGKKRQTYYWVFDKIRTKIIYL
jgi:hypothetical protein